MCETCQKNVENDKKNLKFWWKVSQKYELDVKTFVFPTLGLRLKINFNETEKKSVVKRIHHNFRSDEKTTTLFIFIANFDWFHPFFGRKTRNEQINLQFMNFK